MPTSEANPSDDVDSNDMDRRSRSSVEFDQILSSVGPVALAGGFFPAIVAVIALVGMVIGFIIRQLSGSVPLDADLFGEIITTLLFAVGGSMLGFVLGIVFAAVVSLYFAIMVGILHWSTKETVHPRLMCQLVGGLTGYWSIAAMGFGGPWAWQFIASNVALASLAMVVGQCGAAVGYHRMHAGYVQNTDAKEWQFGIREMMVGMIWIAAIFALFVALPQLSYVFLACWVVLQALVFVAGESIRRYRIRNGGLRTVA